MRLYSWHIGKNIKMLNFSFIPNNSLVQIDGMDIFAVKNAVEFAIKFASEGNGPIILEMRTYRYFGHSMSDPGSTYRTRDEVAHTRKTRDPMLKLRQMLVGANLTTNEELNVSFIHVYTK